MNAHPPPGESTAELADKATAQRAARKLFDGQDLTKTERDALARFEKAKEERLRWQYYHTVPKKHYRAMSGRQDKVLNEQAKRYDLPIGGPVVDLEALIRRIHDFLAENHVKLARDEDPLMQGSGSPALEKYREEKAALARLDRLEREGQLHDRDQVRQGLARLAAILRHAGDLLERQHSPEAAGILREALDEFLREAEQMFGGEADADHDAPAD